MRVTPGSVTTAEGAPGAHGLAGREGPQGAVPDAAHNLVDLSRTVRETVARAGAQAPDVTDRREHEVVQVQDRSAGLAATSGTGRTTKAPTNGDRGRRQTSFPPKFA